MKEKTLLLAACLLLAANTLSAKSLVLTLKDGTHVYYLLEENSNPKMRFVDGKIAVDANEYEFSDIRNFFISATDDPNGIDRVGGDAAAKYNNGTVVFDTDRLPYIKVYAANGCEVNIAPRQAGGKTIVDLTTLPQGAYILTTGEASLKIHKK